MLKRTEFDEVAANVWELVTPDNSPMYTGAAERECNVSPVDVASQFSMPLSADVRPKTKLCLTPEVHSRSSSCQKSVGAVSLPQSRALSQVYLADRHLVQGSCSNRPHVSREDIATICAPLFQKMITAVESAVQMRLDPPGYSGSPRTDLTIPESVQQDPQQFAQSVNQHHTTNVCCHWKAKGYCWYQDRCKFLHPAEKRGSGKVGIIPLWVSSGGNMRPTTISIRVCGQSEVKQGCGRLQSDLTDDNASKMIVPWKKQSRSGLASALPKRYCDGSVDLLFGVSNEVASDEGPIAFW